MPVSFICHSAVAPVAVLLHNRSDLPSPFVSRSPPVVRMTLSWIVTPVLYRTTSGTAKSDSTWATKGDGMPKIGSSACRLCPMIRLRWIVPPLTSPTQMPERPESRIVLSVIEMFVLPAAEAKPNWWLSVDTTWIAPSEVWDPVPGGLRAERAVDDVVADHDVVRGRSDVAGVERVGGRRQGDSRIARVPHDVALDGHATQTGDPDARGRRTCPRPCCR